MHHYIYYHCTRKINPDCIEKAVEIKELNKQIDTILAGLTISEKFQKWALEYVHELNKQEASTRETTISVKHKDYERVTTQLSNLLLAYTSPENAESQLMTEQEYISARTPLLKEKSALEAELSGQGKKAKEWL